jgi:molybdopterin synthase sulfur carrier subunit
VTAVTRVLLFGRLRDVAGWRERVFHPAPETLLALRAIIAEEDPALSAALGGPGVRAAVDQQLVQGDVFLGPGAEVAFMPAMSGG